MMKLRIPATKLENADVSFISLVERGANRSPFKIIKQERKPAMFNLDLKFGTKKSAPVTAVVGLIIKEEHDNDAIRKSIKDAGFSVDGVVKYDDGTVLFKQGDVEMKEDDPTIVPIRASDNLIVIAKNFKPQPVEGRDNFGDIVKTEGFLPGLSMATAALAAVVKSVEGMEPAKAVAKMDEATNDFHAYSFSLLSCIPTSVFKLAGTIDAQVATIVKDGKVCKECSAKMSDDESGEVCKGCMSKKDEAAKAEEAKKAAEAAAAEEAKKQADAEAAKKTAAAPTAVTTETVAAQVNAGIEKAMKGLGDVVSNAVKAALAPIEKQVGEVTKSVDEAKALAKKTDDALKGVVLTPDSSDDGDGGGKTTQKAEAGEGRCIDTAYDRSVRKSDVRYSQQHRTRRT